MRATVTKMLAYFVYYFLYGVKLSLSMRLPFVYVVYFLVKLSSNCQQKFNQFGIRYHLVARYCLRSTIFKKNDVVSELIDVD